MSTDLMPFNYEGQQVRTVVIDGNPEFVAADVCRVLDHSNPSAAVAGLDEDERGLRNVETPSGEQNMVTVTEPGLYSLIIRSRKPEAKAFRRWIIHEVLPTIRKTGSYGKAIDGASITRLELIQIAMNAETERLALAQENKELAPKADAYDSFIDATGYYSVGAVAKMIGKSQNWLFRELRNLGVLIAKGSMRNTPYQRYMHHFVVRAREFERRDGEMGTAYTTYVQPSGINFIRKKLGLPSIDPLPVAVAS